MCLRKVSNTFIVSCAAFVMVACASSSKEIAATYVSPAEYASFSCDQLSQELARLNKKKNDLAFELDEKASSDEGLTAVSVILFWPAAFALGGNEEQEAEYARIKGEYDAVQKAGVEKSCNLDPARVQIAKIEKQTGSGDSSSAIEFYGEAEEEINTGSYDKDLWAKALVDVEGDENRRRAKYIELRANQLYSEKVGAVSGTVIPQEPAVAEGRMILDLSGNYRSKITGSYRVKSAFVIEQDGNRIKGMSLNKDWEFEGSLEEDTLVLKWWSPGNKGKGKFTVDPYGNMAGSYVGDSWGKGEWALVRNDEPPGMMIIAPDSNSNPQYIANISGTYISEITSNSKWQFTKRYQNLKIKFQQEGNKIVGIDERYDTKIEATIAGDSVKFYVLAGQAAGGYDAEGEWKISADGTRLVGSWNSPGSADAASGEWILRKVQ
ncbi:MAG: hypothetical protein QNJ85_07235 [Gammaproteobacteria bacterium]|nr:hypothetical protein [Gammaproteobacteria bacterium]